MVTSVYDLRSFYECQRGRIIQPLIQQKILSMWPDVRGKRLLGCGYAVPFLEPYRAEAERVVALMPSQFGVHAWSPAGKNLACVCNETELPIETESVDRILLIHGLEHTDYTQPALQELWRTMKSTGRILVIVPNRHGFWSRAEWSPFGHGIPFSASQLINSLKNNLFVVERVEKALYLPAIRSSVILRASLPLEKYGRYLGGMGGVLVIEASKQLYGGLSAHNTAKAGLHGRRVLVPRVAPGN